MADIEQWVNTTRERKWLGEGLARVSRTTEVATLRVSFDQPKRCKGYLTFSPADTNAAYSSTEQARQPSFNRTALENRPFMTADDGTAEVPLLVSAAGGDEFTVTVQDKHHNEILADTVKTRRKLYFQVISMTGATLPDSSTIRRLRSEYWAPSDRLYIKLVEHTQGRTIPDRGNYDKNDSSMVREVKSQARGQYNREKNPLGFCVLMVKAIGSPRVEEATLGATFPDSDPRRFEFHTHRPVFRHTDPNAAKFETMQWITSKGTKTISHHHVYLDSSDRTWVRIDTRRYRKGPGVLRYRIQVLDGAYGGLSYSGSNFIVVGTVSARNGNAYPQRKILAVLVHEIGHKIGMVPGTQSDRLVDRQASRYTGRSHTGNHCSTGGTWTGGRWTVNGTCTMFGAVVRQTPDFCSVCRRSLRKLCLRANRNSQVRTQF